MIQIVNYINSYNEIHKHVMIFTTEFVGSDKRGSTVYTCSCCVVFNLLILWPQVPIMFKTVMHPLTTPPY